MGRQQETATRRLSRQRRQQQGALRCFQRLLAVLKRPAASGDDVRAFQQFLSTYTKGHVVMMAPVVTALRDISGGEMAQLKQDLIAFVGMLAGNAPDSRVTRRLTIHVLPTKSGTRNVLLLDGAPFDVLAFAISRVLDLAGNDRVRACPQCDAVFVKIGRRKFCSDRCVARAHYKPTPRSTRHHGHTTTRTR
jgi:hypothetical protein